MIEKIHRYVHFLKKILKTKNSMRSEQNTLKIPHKFEKCLEISSLQVSPQFNFNQIEIKKTKNCPM
jgi:hypothetical protein